MLELQKGRCVLPFLGNTAQRTVRQMCSRFFVRSSKNSAGILAYVKGFLGKMTEKMQTDDVLSRQAVFVRCCLYQPTGKELLNVLSGEIHA